MADSGPVVTGFRSLFRAVDQGAGLVAVTLWLIWWFVTWVDNLVRPIIPVAYRPETYLPVNIPGLGLIIVFVALTLLGFLTANLIGRKLVDFGESLLNHMPIVRPIFTRRSSARTKRLLSIPAFTIRAGSAALSVRASRRPRSGSNAR